MNAHDPAEPIPIARRMHSMCVDADKVNDALTYIHASGGLVTAGARCRSGFVITYVVLD